MHKYFKYLFQSQVQIGKIRELEFQKCQIFNFNSDKNFRHNTLTFQTGPKLVDIIS